MSVAEVFINFWGEVFLHFIVTFIPEYIDLLINYNIRIFFYQG